MAYVDDLAKQIGTAQARLTGRPSDTDFDVYYTRKGWVVVTNCKPPRKHNRELRIVHEDLHTALYRTRRILETKEI